MVIKVVKKYQKTIRCCICLEDYHPASLSFQSNHHDMQETTATTTNNHPVLFAPEGCCHHLCQPCLEKYTITSIKQANEEQITDLELMSCPEPDCTETYLVEEIIALALPFKQRMVYWWLNKLQGIQQHYLEKSTAIQKDEEEHLQKKKKTVKKMKKRTSSSATVAAIAAAAAASPSSVLFFEDGKKINDKSKKSSDKIVKMALKKNWTRCPQCKYLVQRKSGCDHMSCPCGATFCYRCGATCGADKTICKANRQILREEMKQMLM